MPFRFTKILQMTKTQFGSAEFERHLSGLEIDGLHGRLWQAPALDAKFQDHLIILIYGQHSSLERSAGLVQYLRRFGRVVMPDLPGMGGMDSFYQNSSLPTIDNYAHYLEKFLSDRYKKKQTFSILGFSFGFLVVTRFLQLYPHRQKYIRRLFSLIGLVDGRSLSFSAFRRFSYLGVIAFIKTRPGSFCFKHLFLNGWVLRCFYSRILSARGRFAHYPPSRRRELMEVEIKLWRVNDLRTWAFTAGEIIKGDLTASPIDLRLGHVFAKGDHLLDNQDNKQRLSLVYNEVKLFRIDLANHAPTVVASPDEVEALMPPEFAAALSEEVFMKKKQSPE